jgi:tRNA threonylcarbamoyl adenosine modification protein YeaZ
MNILALDTSMGACSAAVFRQRGDARAVFSRYELMNRGHAEALMPMMAEVMEEAGLSFGDLDMIAATLGPGSFTGVRIAIAAALGLALVVPVKLFGTDSLSVMARTALTGGMAPHGPFAVAVDARRGMLYLALFDADGTRQEGPLLIAPDDAIDKLPRALHFVIGSGAELVAEAAAQRGKRFEAMLPELQLNASALAELAFSSDKTFSTLRPLYLRPPEARPQDHKLVARR